MIDSRTEISSNELTQALGGLSAFGQRLSSD